MMPVAASVATRASARRSEGWKWAGLFDPVGSVMVFRVKMPLDYNIDYARRGRPPAIYRSS